MPKTLSSAVVATDLRLDSLVVAFPHGETNPAEVTVTYSLVDAAGTALASHAVGGITLPPGLITALKNHWPQLLGERKAAEGV